jgi:hypothetical protein
MDVYDCQESYLYRTVYISLMVILVLWMGCYLVTKNKILEMEMHF